MLYQMRLTNGEIDPISSGTLVARGRQSQCALTSADFQMTPETFWKSERTQAQLSDRLASRSSRKKNSNSRVQPVLADQELRLDPMIYWEGAFDVSGTRAGRPITGRGYLELTGYAGRCEIEALTRERANR